jgi:hypothetical protein
MITVAVCVREGCMTIGVGYFISMIADAAADRC